MSADLNVFIISWIDSWQSGSGVGTWEWSLSPGNMVPTNMVPIQIDVVYTDFEKAFDKVPHQGLISKLAAYNLNNTLLLWI